MLLSCRKEGLNLQAIFETIFDICYLIFVISTGIVMVRKAKGNRQFTLFGIMAIVLGCGDAFHLVPRVIALCTTGMQDYTAALGIGKLVTSITMTLFYVLLYYVWQIRYGKEDNKALTWTVWVLAIVRIGLCLFPQNQWTSAHEPLDWGIYRNIPFAILGVVMIVLFWKSAGQDKSSPFHWMWLAITLSFGFYIPVVLFASTMPMIGMLMIPKTLCYVWIVVMGYQAMQKELQA